MTWREILEDSDSLIPKSSHELEEKLNRYYDSMMDKGTNGEGKVELKKLKYTYKKAEDEIEQAFSDWDMQISQDELKIRFHYALKKSTFRNIESLIIKNERLNDEVRRLRRTMNDVQGLLEEVENGELDARNKGA